MILMMSHDDTDLQYEYMKQSFLLFVEQFVGIATAIHWAEST